jgi:hypothetical protein
MIEQVDAFLDEDVDQFSIQVGEVECFVGVLGGRLHLRKQAFDHGLGSHAFGRGDAFGFESFVCNACRIGTFGFGTFRFGTFRFGTFGFDAFGFDAFGFDAPGFDAFGFDTPGFRAFRVGAFRVEFLLAGDAILLRVFGLQPRIFRIFLSLEAFGFDAFGFDAFGFETFGFEAIGFDAFVCFAYI